jgi:hypothetical protein
LEDDKENIYKTFTDANGRVGLNGLPRDLSLKMKVNIGIEGSEDLLIKCDEDGGSISLMKANTILQ